MSFLIASGWSPAGLNGEWILNGIVNYSVPIFARPSNNGYTGSHGHLGHTGEIVNSTFIAYNKDMIASITGKVTHKATNYIIAQIAGVGYKIFVTPILMATVKLNQDISLVIHTYVREDQITLYGFPTLPELEFFEMLLTVSGVGPKSALGIMSLAEIKMIKSAIVSEDPSVFTKVAGIGRKTAERVIVELKEKLKDE